MSQTRLAPKSPRPAVPEVYMPAMWPTELFTDIARWARTRLHRPASPRNVAPGAH